MDALLLAAEGDSVQESAVKAGISIFASKIVRDGPFRNIWLVFSSHSA